MKTLTKNGRWIAATLCFCAWALGVYNSIAHLAHGTALGILAGAGTAAYIMLIAIVFFGRRVI